MFNYAASSNQNLHCEGFSFSHSMSDPPVVLTVVVFVCCHHCIITFTLLLLSTRAIWPFYMLLICYSSLLLCGGEGGVCARVWGRACMCILVYFQNPLHWPKLYAKPRNLTLAFKWHFETGKKFKRLNFRKNKIQIKEQYVTIVVTFYLIKNRKWCKNAHFVLSYWLFWLYSDFMFYFHCKVLC